MKKFCFFFLLVIFGYSPIHVNAKVPGTGYILVSGKEKKIKKLSWIVRLNQKRDRKMIKKYPSNSIMSSGRLIEIKSLKCTYDWYSSRRRS